jgi:hypothetical protein
LGSRGFGSVPGETFEAKICVDSRVRGLLRPPWMTLIGLITDQGLCMTIFAEGKRDWLGASAPLIIKPYSLDADKERSR